MFLISPHGFKQTFESMNEEVLSGWVERATVTVIATARVSYFVKLPLSTQNERSTPSNTYYSLFYDRFVAE